MRIWLNRSLTAVSRQTEIRQLHIDKYLNSDIEAEAHFRLHFSSFSLSMVFTIRLRSRRGMKRLDFASDQSKWNELQKAIADATQCPVDTQLLSRTPLHEADYMQPQLTQTFAQLKIKHGDILYLAGEPDDEPNDASKATTNGAAAQASASSSASSAAPAPQRKLSPNCRHGPAGACPHCMGVRPGDDLSKASLGSCNHSASATCIHCSSHVKDVKAAPAAWLCNHPDTVFCPKCMPPEDESEKGKRRTCTCDHSKGQQCTACLSKPSTLKVDKIPFNRYLDDKRALCKFKHGDKVTCAFCAVPHFPSFAPKAVCNRHPPGGSCLQCAPPNCNLKVQAYRHCDTISIEGTLLFNWYAAWIRSQAAVAKTPALLVQRAAVLFGRVIDEPAESGNPFAVRSLVAALYEPPQNNTPNSIRLLPDDNESLIHLVASRLGLTAVGWCIGTQPREGKQYGGKVLLSGLEVQQAARFQHRYRLDNGYSQFVTVVVEHTAQVEPVAYQVSDAAVALEQDGFLAKADDPYMLSTRKPAGKEQVPTIVYKDRPLQPGDQFLPDELLVKVNLTAPRPNSKDLLFKSFGFPFSGAQFTEASVRHFLSTHSKEEYETKLSDFNLLVCLAKLTASKPTTDQATILAVCDAISKRQSIPTPVREQLDRIFIEKNFF